MAKGGYREGSGSGGKRPGAGRKPNKPEAGDAIVSVIAGKGFTGRVFSRIHELKLKRLGTDGKELGLIENAEDFALESLRPGPLDASARAFFKDLLLWQLGKPVQPTIQADTREGAPELDFGNLVMPAAGKTKPGTAGKPN